MHSFETQKIKFMNTGALFVDVLWLMTGFCKKGNIIA